MKLGWLALAAAISAGSTAVQAGEWVVLSRTDTNAIGLDRSRIRTDNSIRTFWVVTVEKDTQTDRQGQKFDYTLQQVRVDCSQSTIQSLYTGFYSLDSGVPISTDNFATTKSPVVPDTQGETLEEYVCAPTWRQIPFASENAQAFAKARRTGNLGSDRIWRGEFN